jgi:hypothetical protein
LADVLRPFLEKWQADYRSWWEMQDKSNRTWIDIQAEYPRNEELLSDWTNLRKLLRKLEHKLRDEYKLQAID